MSRLSQFGMSLLALSVVLWIAGCNSSTPQSEDQSTESNGEDHDHGDDADHDHGDDHGDHEHGGEADAATIEKAFAKLSAEDRTLAEQQKICPVADGPLGMMGMPIKLTVNGKDVFICCAGCEDKLRADPDKYLAKLEK